MYYKFHGSFFHSNDNCRALNALVDRLDNFLQSIKLLEAKEGDDYIKEVGWHDLKASKEDKFRVENIWVLELRETGQEIG